MFLETRSRNAKLGVVFAELLNYVAPCQKERKKESERERNRE
jgi:hypothetical protein